MQWLLVLSTPCPPVATWKQAVSGLPSYLFKKKSGDDCSWLLLGCDLPSCTHQSRRRASTSSSPTIPLSHTDGLLLGRLSQEWDGRQERCYLIARLRKLLCLKTSLLLRQMVTKGWRRGLRTLPGSMAQLHPLWPHCAPGPVPQHEGKQPDGTATLSRQLMSFPAQERTGRSLPFFEPATWTNSSGYKEIYLLRNLFVCLKCK